ncbi:MAG: hypothetical protein IPO52_08735 [Gemmatimonadetes bacterium]|nr:hypothetical protein [Gemmatimonadota bacterium]
MTVHVLAESAGECRRTWVAEVLEPRENRVACRGQGESREDVAHRDRQVAHQLFALGDAVEAKQGE